MSDTVIGVLLAGFLGYLVYDEFHRQKSIVLPRKRLCDYYTAGSVFEDIPTVLNNGCRLIELHVYSDEQDQPVVSKKPLQQGYDYADDNVTFEQVCIDIGNLAFPSADPFILSIVPHTQKTVTFNRMAEILTTSATRPHLVKGEVSPTTPIDELKDKIIIVAGGVIAGTEFEKLVNLDWNGSLCRRLSYNQAVHPRDQPELVQFDRHRITLVGPDMYLGKTGINRDTPFAYGCQWNLFSSSWAPHGFVEKHVELQ